MQLLNEQIINTIINISDESELRFIIQMVVVISAILFFYSNTSAKENENKARDIFKSGIELAEPGLNKMECALQQNSPNPFSDSTSISYKINSRCKVLLEIFNDKIEQVAQIINEIQDRGEYVISLYRGLNGLALPEGVYFYRLKADDFVDVKKMIITR